MMNSCGAGFGWRRFGWGLLLALTPTAALTAQTLPRTTPTEAAAPDSFPHSRHATLACLTCHVVGDRAHGLVFERPRGCELCHHQAAMRGRFEVAECASCHSRLLPTPPGPGVASAAGPARRRFRHDRHTARACVTCHVPSSLAPSKAQVTCTACHEDHHAARRDCAECHRSPDLADTHDRATHRGCDKCHKPATIAALVPDRGFCVTCHEGQRDHRSGGECTTCHFLATPAAFRPRLRAKPAP